MKNSRPIIKVAGFYGLGFIRYGDVSCFIWFFCTKTIVNILLSASNLVKRNENQMPDLLANLVQPRVRKKLNFFEIVLLENCKKVLKKGEFFHGSY